MVGQPPDLVPDFLTNICQKVLLELDTVNLATYQSYWHRTCSPNPWDTEQLQTWTPAIPWVPSHHTCHTTSLVDIGHLPWTNKPLLTANSSLTYTWAHTHTHTHTHTLTPYCPYQILIMFWFPCKALSRSRLATLGVALLTNASMGIKFDPLA